MSLVDQGRVDSGHGGLGGVDNQLPMMSGEKVGGKQFSAHLFL
jgi:hypothetical protein